MIFAQSHQCLSAVSAHSYFSLAKVLQREEEDKEFWVIGDWTFDSASCRTNFAICPCSVRNRTDAEDMIRHVL